MTIRRKDAGQKAMKTGLKGVALLAALILVFAVANPAAAETLGDKLAAKLCFNNNTHSYTLSSTDMAYWTAQAVSGSYTGTTDGTNYVAHFSKSAQNDDAADCTKNMVGSASGCSKWSITKSGATLYKGTNARPCRD